MKMSIFNLLAVALLCTIADSWAAVTCTAPVSTGFSTAYAPTGIVPNVTQGTVSFNCTRTDPADPLTGYGVRADNGIHATGQQNRVNSGGNFLTYFAYQDSACTSIWSRPNFANQITFSLADVVVPQTINLNYWGCITTAGQIAPAGTYTGMITMQVRRDSGATIYSSATFGVTVINPATCAITRIDNVAFPTYVAFRNTPLVAPSANIELDCTNRLPYTMALNATGGVVVGLNYFLALSTSSSRGTGPGQIHTITGTMPANQAGTCAGGKCSGTNIHTLTITY